MKIDGRVDDRTAKAAGLWSQTLKLAMETQNALIFNVVSKSRFN